MKNRNLIIAAVCLALLVAAVFSPAGTVHADKKDIQNVVLAADGTLTWDPFDGAVKYWITFGEVAFEPEGTSDNLYDRAIMYHFKTGTYGFSLVACNESWNDISNHYSGSFDFTAPIGLETPTGMKWDGRKAVWNSVDGALEYEVYVYRGDGGYESSYRTEDTFYDFSDSIYFLTGREYCFTVVALGETGKGDSEESAKSALTEGWFNKTDIQNVRLSEDGILSWDPYEGATHYWVWYGPAATEPIGYSIDLFMISAACEYETGDYGFSVVACNDNWNNLSYVYSGTYHYEKSFLVTFDTGEAKQVPPQLVKEGGKATEPEDIPEFGSFEFAYWKLGDEMYDFNTVLTGNITLTPLYFVKAEAHAYPAEGGFVYTGEAYPPETGDPDMAEKWGAEMEETSIAEFGAKANDGYIFKGWRAGSPTETGVDVTGDQSGDFYLDAEDNTRVNFKLNNPQYVFYAIFEKVSGDPEETATPEVSAEPETTEMPENTEEPTSTEALATETAENPTGEAPETQEPGENPSTEPPVATENPDGGGKTEKNLKAALIAVSVVAGVLLAGAAAVIIILLLKRKK
ncbi:MAG: InlB B-repeat-containing protein [Clostridia bacterium]|nr:InlB B-repeat-containing protein [Clostridia bacterium]